MHKIVLFYVTFDSETAAQSMIDQLIKEKLIACGNILPINSIYLWEGTVCNENEFVAILKTSKLKHENAESRIEELHSYEVPCIITWEANCNEKYYNWILECTR